MTNSVPLFIDGTWGSGASKRTLPFWNPATSGVIGEVAVAEKADLDRALAAAEAGFHVWRAKSAFDRHKILRAVGDLLRARADEIGEVLTLEQGKPLAQAKQEAAAGGDILDWLAEEGRRHYGR